MADATYDERAEKAERTYKILVYGIEKKGLEAPPKKIKDRNYELIFDSFQTTARFNDFDGVILFQGIFEEIVYAIDACVPCIINCERDELDRREKELKLLLRNKGFVCFILCKQFIDAGERGDRELTYADLSKRCLNIPHLWRKGIGGRITDIEPKLHEFSRFFDLYGVAETYFDYLIGGHDDIEEIGDHIKVIARVGTSTVGMVVFNHMFFIPSLIPPDLPERVEEYFKLLAEALTSTLNKLIYDIPAWVDRLQFEEETRIIERKKQIIEEIQKIDERLALFQDFKRILIPTGDPLVEAVVKVFRDGFGLTVDDNDEHKEDAKILDSDGKPMILVEIKGANGSVTRTNVYQAESHRERANLPPDFPSILIVNTDIKNSRTLEEKDHPIAGEQVKLAKDHNVLVLRTFDLLNLLHLFMKNSISRDDIITIMKEKSGWLKVSDQGWEILPSE